MTTFMFPGQGSQNKGMGADLFVQFPKKMKMANEILGYSIEDLCLTNPQNKLNNTEFTQPALYIVEALAYEANYAHRTEPNYCIGHSVGEYAALYAAKAFDFITGLKLVKKRGELMAQAKGGGMLAVVNTSYERVKLILEEANLTTIDFANLNSTKQIVLSGLAPDINKANEILSDKDLMCIPLQVSGAFHSRYMEAAAKEFELFLKPFEFSKPQIEVIANLRVEPYSEDNIKENLIKQITSPVRWAETIRHLKNKNETEFIEVGPGNVLTRLMAHN